MLNKRILDCLSVLKRTDSNTLLNSLNLKHEKQEVYNAIQVLKNSGYVYAHPQHRYPESEDHPKFDRIIITEKGKEYLNTLVP